MTGEAIELVIEESTSTTNTEFTGDVWELYVETGQRGLTGLGGAGGTITHLVDLFVEDVDAAGGSFTSIQLVGSISLPRASAVGFVVCVVSGASVGIWRITASGPCTEEVELAPGDSISALSGQIGVAQTNDGTNVATVVVASNVGELTGALARLDVLETDLPAGDIATLAKANNNIRAEVLARATGPLMHVGTPYGGSHDDGAYTTPTPGEFTDGFWIRSASIPLPNLDAYTSPSDGDEAYGEIFTKTAEGIGVWDLVEKAWLWKYDASAGIWRCYLYIEITFVGDTSETVSLTTASVSSVGSTDYPITEFEGYCLHETAVWFQFDNGDGVWELGLYRRMHQGIPDLVGDGAEWELLTRAVGSSVGSVEAGSYPWAIGFGSPDQYLKEVKVNDGGPDGTTMANPTADLAVAAGEGVAFDDAQTNTWTPGPDTSIYDPSAAGVPTSRLVSAGTGLTGGGDLSADRTLAVDFGEVADTAAEGVAILRTPWRSGSYYGTNAPRTFNGGQTLASGEARAMPFYNPIEGRSIDEIAVDVQAGSAGSGTLYICTDDGSGYPDAVVASGTFSTPVTSARSTVSVSYDLPRGLLWLVAHGTGTTWSGLSFEGQSILMPAPSSYATAGVTCWRVTGAGTSTFTSFPAGGSLAVGVQVLVRAA